LASTPYKRFDYIVHDVFTGGVEPAALFTVEFLTDLRTALKPNGVIAIVSSSSLFLHPPRRSFRITSQNYAGDMTLSSASLVICTIKAVFPNCRFYRESEPLTAAESAAKARDFVNMVIFCTNTKDPIKFREPIEADFLGSEARQAFLVPTYEISGDVLADLQRQGKGELLKRGNTAALEVWQRKSAIEHWGIMRMVLPGDVWQLW